LDLILRLGFKKFSKNKAYTNFFTNLQEMLLSKLHIPVPSKDIVQRRVLYDKLSDGINGKLTIVSAPAGYGKTTLISDWIGQHKTPVAWFSIDTRDNEPSVFLNLLICSIQITHKKIGESAKALLNSANNDKKYILELLINDIVQHKENIILVIDDFHMIHNKVIFELFGFFLDYLPVNLHVIILTRSDPPINTARLRSRNEFTEIRSADLSFSQHDISVFFNKKLKLNLSQEDIRMLGSKTEGWIAGLQLAAISFQGQNDISASINRMSGDNRYFVDYLMEEVLNGLSDEVRNFLLKTSILNKLSGSLCDAVLQLKNSETILESLEKRNIFLISLDDERKWFRYHHLFANLLRSRLSHSFNDQISKLHSLASDWYIRNDLTEDAIEHLIEIKEYERTSTLIIDQFDKIWESGQHYKFERWLNNLPDEFIFSRPQLLILKAEILATHWSINEALELLQTAKQMLNDDKLLKSNNQGKTLSPSYINNMSGRIAANQALIYSFKEDVEKVLFYSNEAQNLLSVKETTWLSIVAISIGDAHFLNGDLEMAFSSQSEALNLCEQSGNRFLTLIANANIAVTQRQQGKLKESLEKCELQIQYAYENALSNSIVVGWLYTIMGEILIEINKPDEAISNARKGIQIIDKCGDSGMLFKSYLLLTRVLFSQGNLNETEKAIGKLQFLAQETNVTRNIDSAIKAWQGKIWLAQGNLISIKKILETEKNQSKELLFIHETENILMVRIYLKHGFLKESMNLVNSLIENAESGERVNSLIELLLLKALIYDNLGDKNEAREILLKSLILAEPGGYIRIFIEEGEILNSILKEISKDKSIKSTSLLNEISVDYLNNLKLAFEIDKRKREQSESDLSNREIEILNLIVKKLSNKEISETLYISLSTVKTHISSILLKLNAKNRIEATEIAMQKGIV